MLYLKVFMEFKYHRNSLISEDREEYMNCLFRIIGLRESLLFIILYLNTNLFFSDPFSLKTFKIPPSSPQL